MLGLEQNLLNGFVDAEASSVDRDFRHLAGVRDAGEFRGISPACALAYRPLRSPDSMVIHKSGPRPDLAQQFINFMLDGRNSAELTNLVGSGNPNRAALPYTDPAIASNQAIFPPPAVQRRLEMLRDLNRTQRRVLSLMWTEIKVR